VKRTRPGKGITKREKHLKGRGGFPGGGEKIDNRTPLSNQLQKVQTICILGNWTDGEKYKEGLEEKGISQSSQGVQTAKVAPSCNRNRRGIRVPERGSWKQRFPGGAHSEGGVKKKPDRCTEKTCAPPPSLPGGKITDLSSSGKTVDVARS